MTAGAIEIRIRTACGLFHGSVRRDLWAFGEDRVLEPGVYSFTGFSREGKYSASHDNQSSPSFVKKKRTFSELEASIASKIHGHTAYSLVCEIARVPELIAYLNQKNIYAYF